MDGKLNCSMTAENAAFTKIRHLENRVVETETRLDILEQETTQLDEALQNVKDDISETVVTENVDTALLRADSIGTALITADDIDVKDMTATTIEAETIDVDNLENVNVLHGKTVDVEKTIATIGQFTETQTGTANNGITNTEELNVSTEANLTGQVNIDGNVTFTKDNGLSKLQGNYLEIDAANVVIDNKNDAEYALLVPGINGDALFGGSVAVQDTLAAKNLMVTEEAHTTTANNRTTNTEELNVSNETNLTGQVNIDGNVTFTKDNDLSKLQGNYLEIDAANVVIDNKNNAEYALLVPGINGGALFGGSVTVQDTLATKNLAVTGETFFDNIKLDENAVLDNPTLENITETQGLTDRALDIDENGKLVRKFVAGGSAGSVANALIANETRYKDGLLDKYKQVEEEGAPYRIVLSDTASYTFYPDFNGNAYLENSNGQRYEFENSNNAIGALLPQTSLVHKNIFYAVVFTFDDDVMNVIGATLLKINMNNMNVEYSIDISEHLYRSVSSLPDALTWIPSQCGNILPDDKPVLPLVDTNEYVDLVSGNILRRERMFTPGDIFYLSKTNKWYMLGGNAAHENYWATNNKYSSIEDAALVETPYQDANAYIVDAPVFMYNGEKIKWFNGGTSKASKLNGKTILVLDENDNKVLFSPGRLMFNGVEYATNLYNNFGYVVNEYIAEIPYYVEKVTIDRTEADFTDVPITADTITINDKATIKDIETSTITAGNITITSRAAINDKATIREIASNIIGAQVVQTIDVVADVMTINDRAAIKDIETSTITISDKATVKDIETSNVDAEVVKTIDAEVDTITINDKATIKDIETSTITISDKATVKDIETSTITISDKATIKDVETSTIETSTIDAEVVKTVDAEVDGMTFYRGKWYDKVFSSAKPLVDYILDTTDKSPYQTYNILFTGDVLDFRSVDLPNNAIISSSQVIGTYKVYSDSNDDVRELNFVENGYDPFIPGKHLFDKMHFYGFKTQLDVASINNTKYLHINNCTLHFKDNYGANTSVGTFELNKCNNVSITATNINWSSFPRPVWENCNNVQLRQWGFIQGGTYTSMSIWMVDCNDCYIAVPPINIKSVTFGQVGKGNNLVVHFKSEYGTKEEPTYTTTIQ